MKIPRLLILAFAAAGLASVHAQDYTNFIRQVQLPSGVQWDAAVAATGQRNSLLALDIGGARFELWTVRNSPLTSFLLDTRFVGAFAPSAEIRITSEDPYTVIPRTRADRPFFVTYIVSGLLSTSDAPASARSVRFLRHVQSYGLGGTGSNIDRSQATLLSQSSITSNGTQTLTYAVTAIPGADRTKVTGEERFSIFSVADEFGPESQLASRYIQIWPLADGSITGITSGQLIRFKLPQITLTLNDLYPQSDTYAQVYKGQPRLGVTGTRIASIVCNDSVPRSRVLLVKDYDSAFDSDGTWTIELVTVTPFGTERLSFLSFELNRTLRVNTMLSSSE